MEGKNTATTEGRNGTMNATKKSGWALKRSDDIGQYDDEYVLEKTMTATDDDGAVWACRLSVQVCSFYVDAPYQLKRTGYDKDGNWAWVQDVGPERKTLKAAMAAGDKIANATK